MNRLSTTIFSLSLILVLWTGKLSAYPFISPAIFDDIHTEHAEWMPPLSIRISPATFTSALSNDFNRWFAREVLPAFEWPILHSDSISRINYALPPLTTDADEPSRPAKPPQLRTQVAEQSSPAPRQTDEKHIPPSSITSEPPNAMQQNLPVAGHVAIIIDDLGNSLRKGLDALALPGKITYSVLPHRKHSQRLAQRGYRLNKEIMLHIPMATVNNRALGAGALSGDLTERQFKQTLQHAIRNVPHLKGVNNHMGSQLTQNKIAMGWVMEVLQSEQLFFVDSRTTAQSVAFDTAIQHRISSAQRDVFLDHQVNTEHIHQQFKRALAVALKHGSAVVIGHPHPETVHYLKQVIPELPKLGIALSTVSELMAKGIHQRPSHSGYGNPIQAPTLDTLIQHILAQKEADGAAKLL